MKEILLGYAEVIDAWRIIPRIILLFYGLMVWDVVTWYMALATPTTTQMGLVTTIVGTAALVIGLYNNSGRKWG